MKRFCLLWMILTGPAWAADPGMDALIDLLAHTQDIKAQQDLLRGMSDGLADRRRAPMPAAWTALYPKLASSTDPDVARLALRLALKFGDPQADQQLRTIVTDAAVPAPQRIEAMAALIDRQDPKLPPILISLLDDRAVQAAAVRGLAAFDHPQTAEALISRYGAFDAPTRQDAIQTLAARAAWAHTMMRAIEAGAIAKTDLSAFTARQLLNLEDDELARTVQRVWGDVRQTSAAKLAQIEQYRKQLSPKVIAKGDLAQGRLVFKTFCAACHKLFDDGGAIGPDLTGSDRRNLDYVLENLIDPSSAVSKDYQMVVISTTGGRVITGMIRSETDRAVMIQTPGESVTVAKDEIQARQIIPVSMMPEGLLLALKPDQIRDLIAYLQSGEQVTLP